MQVDIKLEKRNKMDNKVQILRANQQVVRIS